MSQANKNIPIVSVVIPAHNEEKYILACLESVFNQSVSQNLYEVILVISKATKDNTEKIAKKFPVKIMYEDGGIGYARYLGSSKAKGEIIAGTDSDTVVSHTWIETIINTFKNKAIVSVTGPIIPPPTATPIQQFAFKTGLTVYKLVSFVDRRAYMAGMNFAVRKTAYDACGGFDPKIKSAEDTDLTIRISKYGKTEYTPKLTVITSTRRLKEGYIQSFVRYSKNFIYLKLKKSPPSFPHFR
jgi:glycosyltransferase involved in cell wall biosynthesis